MIRKFDLLAISLLMATTVIVTAMALDPEGFSLWKWQTLMAALVALGAAALAYRSSMAKVNLDREIHMREIRRRRRGIILRFASMINELSQQAGPAISRIQSLLYVTPDEIPPIEEFKFKIDDSFDEAWKNLDAFSGPMCEKITRLRGLLHYHNEIVGTEPTGDLLRYQLKQVVTISGVIVDICDKIIADMPAEERELL